MKWLEAASFSRVPHRATPHGLPMAYAIAAVEARGVSDEADVFRRCLPLVAPLVQEGIQPLAHQRAGEVPRLLPVEANQRRFRMGRGRPAYSPKTPAIFRVSVAEDDTAWRAADRRQFEAADKTTAGAKDHKTTSRQELPGRVLNCKTCRQCSPLENAEFILLDASC
jgi:hypothetical protein